MSLSQRRKGHDYERRIAQFYRDLGFGARRGQQSRQGDDEPDVIVEGTQLWVECGRRKTGCWIYDKWVQANAARDFGKVPVVHVKPDHGDDLVVISLEEWGRIMKGEP